MTTKSQKPDESPTPAGMLNLTRQQLSMALQATSVVYRAVEAIQVIQQQSTQRVATAHQQFAEKLREAGSPAELMALQFALLASGVQATTQYWQDMAAGALQLQRYVQERKGEVDQSPGVEPALQAWQSLFTSSLNGDSTDSSRHH